MRKPKRYHSGQTVSTGDRQGAGIFGISKPAATTLKAAGGSPGYDPFTKSINLKGGYRPHSPVSKKIYVGSGGGSTGAGSKVSGR